MFLLILRSLLWDGRRPFHFTDEQRDSLSQLGSVNAWLQSKKHFRSHTAPYKIIHYHHHQQDHCHHCVSWLPVKEHGRLEGCSMGDRRAHLQVILHEDQLSLLPAWRSPPLLELHSIRLRSFKRELLLRERRQWKDLGQSHWQFLPNALMFSRPIYGKLKWRYHSRLADVMSPEQEHPWSCIRAGLGEGLRESGVRCNDWDRTYSSITSILHTKDERNIVIKLFQKNLTTKEFWKWFYKKSSIPYNKRLFTIPSLK